MDNFEFIIGVLTFVGVISNIFMTLRISKKQRHAEILSVRRKERIDNLLIFYSKFSALVHPDTIKAYAQNKDSLFIEKLTENYSNLFMLLDHRFPKDTQLANFLKMLEQKAVDYYSICQNKKDSKEALNEYKEEYLPTINKLNKLLNVFVHTEWSRLKKEVLGGKPVAKLEWEKMYEDANQFFEKWDNADPNDL